MLSRFAAGNEELSRELNARRRSYRRPDVHDHLLPEGPKKILALDGGGVRSAMSIAILQKLEKILARRHGNHESFRLADYYDLIGGTSTGAVLAGALASRALHATDLQELYEDVAHYAFRRGGQFDSKRFSKILTHIFGKETLGGELATGLAIVARQVDTDTTLVFHNNPDGPNFNDMPDKARLGFSRYPIANVIHASTARPGEFSPELVELTRHPHTENGVFVDAAFTPFNNPAFQLFLLATLPTRGFGWKIGTENLMVTSVGTGSLCNEVPTSKRHRRASRSISAERGLRFMIDGAEHTGELLMQLLSEPTSPQHPSCEFGDLQGVRLTSEPQCTYQRYQAKLTAQSLAKDFKLGLSPRQLSRVRNMMSRDGLQIAYEIGQAVADTLIREEHFPENFDLERLGLPPVSEKQNQQSADGPEMPNGTGQHLSADTDPSAGYTPKSRRGLAIRALRRR